MRPQARAGGALYPVLMIITILVGLGAMLPQVLLQAQIGIRQDRLRDELSVALDAAVAFAEGRLKRELGERLRLGEDASIESFTVTPSIENPDYGPRHPMSWEARMVRVSPLLIPDEEGVVPERKTFAYRIEARAWEAVPPQRSTGLEINGLVTFVLEGGGPDRSVTEVRFEPLATPRDNLPFGPQLSPSPR